MIRPNFMCSPQAWRPKIFQWALAASICLGVFFISRPTLYGNDLDTSETDTIVSFRGSDVAYGTCTLNQLYFDNLCFKIIGDPEYVQSGILTTTFTPDDRVGPVAGITFINGYTGNSLVQRVDVGDSIRFDIPVVSFQPPDLGAGESLDIFYLEVVDVDPLGPETTIVVGGHDLVIDDVENPNPTPVADENVMPSDEFVVFSVDLAPSQAVPAPVLGDANPRGTASVVINSTTHDVSIAGSYEELTSGPMDVGLYGPASIGEIGPAILGSDSFEIIGSAAAGEFFGAGTLTDLELSHVLAGQTYLNLSTPMNPGGELRGQLLPEPGTASLLVIAGCGVMLFARRRSTDARTQ